MGTKGSKNLGTLTMRVTVRLFAGLREFLPAGTNGSECEMTLQSGATVDDLVARMSIPAQTPKIVLINGLSCSGPKKLTEGDVVSIIPPISGG